MKIKYALVIAVAAVLTAVFVAAAGRDAAKQRVAITMKDLPNGTFVLTPLQAGAIKRDSGKTSVVIGDPTPAVRDGQSYEIYELTWTLKGRLGTLTFRERNDWLDTGDAFIGTGTWKLVKGTGAYARISGSGRSAAVGHDRGNGAWFTRWEGFLSPR